MNLDEAKEMLTKAVTPRKYGTTLQLYSPLFVAIDGSIQSEETQVDVRFGPERTRVYVRWAVPSTKLEWDGRPYVGTDKTSRVVVLGPGGDPVVGDDMKCVWFAVSHAVNQEARARAIFECATPKREPFAEASA